MAAPSLCSLRRSSAGLPASLPALLSVLTLQEDRHREGLGAASEAVVAAAAFTFSLLKEPVILLLRELSVLLTLVPFSTFSVRSASSSFLLTVTHVYCFTAVDPGGPQVNAAAAALPESRGSKRNSLGGEELVPRDVA